MKKTQRPIDRLIRHYGRTLLQERGTRRTVDGNAMRTEFAWVALRVLELRPPDVSEAVGGGKTPDAWWCAAQLGDDSIDDETKKQLRLQWRKENA